MRPNVAIYVVVVAVSVMGGIVAMECRFEDRRLPGSKFVFESGFEGVYCLVISPDHPTALVDAEGFAVYTFDSRGVAQSRTFPAGKGAINQAQFLDRRLNTTYPVANRSPCGSLTFGDRVVLLGVVGSANCPKVDIANPPSFTEALALYCK